ncbi:hypothetical protein Tco_0786919 [Tanacetum coccineum]
MAMRVFLKIWFKRLKQNVILLGKPSRLANISTPRVGEKTIKTGKHLYSSSIIGKTIKSCKHRCSSSIIGRTIKSVSVIIASKVVPPEKNDEALQLLKFIWKEIAKKPKKDIDFILRGPGTKLTTRNVDHAKQPFSERIVKMQFDMQKLISGTAEHGKEDQNLKLKNIISHHIARMHYETQNVNEGPTASASKGIYNLLYEIGSMKDLITPLKDGDKNNMLHLVRKSAKIKRLQDVLGVAFQMQRELLWFKNRKLTRYRLDIEDHEHPIITTIQIPQRGMNFLESYGYMDPMLILMQIPHLFHLKGKLFESCRCLLLVCRYDIGSSEFTIYEMVQGCSFWSVREEDSLLVINLSRKVVQYNQISKTLHDIFDCGSNQLDDNHDDDNDELLQQLEAEHNVRTSFTGCSSSKGCIDDLFLLEEESGNFLNAAMIARSWGDLSKEANLLEKAGEFQEVAMCLIWYVLFRVAWGDGNRGWPLKQFDQMEEICNKVKSLAKRISKGFYEFVCSELKAITTEYYPKQYTWLLHLFCSFLLQQYDM